MKKIELTSLRTLENGTLLHLVIEGVHERIATVSGNIPGDEKFKIEIKGWPPQTVCIDNLPRETEFAIMESEDEWLVPLRERLMDAIFDASDPFLGRIPKDEIAGEIINAASVFTAMSVIDFDNIPFEEIERIAVERFKDRLRAAFKNELEFDETDSFLS